MAAEKPYREEYAEQARKMCQYLGATNEQLWEFFGVSKRHFYDWMNENPEFKAAIDLGKMDADAKVAESLYKRATGYSHPDVDIKVIENCIVETPLIKHYPPDTVACIFWLTNRQRGTWRRKPTEESHADIDRKLKELTAELKKVELDQAKAGNSSDHLTEMMAELIKKLPG